MFTKTIFKNKSKRKRNFIYHFLVERKPHEKIKSIDCSKREYLPDKKEKKVFQQ